MANSRLSKSTFIRGLQCEKSLYLYKHHYRLKDPTPSSLQAVFDHVNFGTGNPMYTKIADEYRENNPKFGKPMSKKSFCIRFSIINT